MCAPPCSAFLLGYGSLKGDLLFPLFSVPAHPLRLPTLEPSPAQLTQALPLPPSCLTSLWPPTKGCCRSGWQLRITT